MTKLLTLFFSVLLAGTNSFGQNNGFIGKKNFIAADLRLFSPMLAGWRSTNDGTYNNGVVTNFKTKGKNFSPSKNLLDFGFNLSLGTAVSRRFGVMFQISKSFYNFSIRNSEADYLNFTLFDSTGSYYSSTLSKSNWFKASTFTYMPILEFSNEEGLLPLGLSHQIGFGIAKHTFVEDDYNIRLYNFGYNNTLDMAPTNLYNFKNGKINSYILMYKINLRIPITKYLLYNLGFRYNLNIVPQNSLFFNNTTSNYFISESVFRKMVKQKELNNIMSLETGISFCF